MNTALQPIGLVLFVAFYALEWHDRPARDNVPVRHPKGKQDTHTTTCDS